MTVESSHVNDENGQENDENEEEVEDNNEVIEEEEVFDDVDVDEGGSYEDRTNGTWTSTDFMDDDGIPLLLQDRGINKRRLDCSTCLDSFICYFDDHVVLKFVIMILKTFTIINELKKFIADILVLGLIPINSREYIWADYG